MDAGTLIFLGVAGLVAVGIVVYHLLRGGGVEGGLEEADRKDDRDRESPGEEGEDESGDDAEDEAAAAETPDSVDPDVPQVGSFAPNPFLLPFPAPPVDFVGRDGEVVRLRAAVEEDEATLVLLTGPAGSGKTALALQLATELAPRFPDARVFVDLQVQGAVDGAAGLQALVRALSPMAPVPVARRPAQYVGQLRTLMTGRQALLVVDAAGPGFELFAPPAGSLLLVTSRTPLPFSGPGAVTEALEELPPEEAAALLRRLSARAGEGAEAIARLCQGQARALRYAAAGLGDRAAFSSHTPYAQALAASLEEHGEPAQAALAVLWSFLPEATKRLLAPLSVFPRSFDAAAAAAVWQRDLAATEEALAELARGELIEALGARYRLAPPVAERADDELDDAGFEAAAQRHAEHYTRLLEEATAELHGDQRLRALQTVEEEWEAIRASQRWAAARTAGNAVAARLASELGEAAQPWLEAFHPEALVTWVEAALAGAREMGDRAAEARHLLALGQARWPLRAHGDDSQVRPLFGEALALARELADPELEMEALQLAGTFEASADRPDLERAIALHEEGLALARQRGDARRTGLFLLGIGGHRSARGETRQAIAAYEEALPLLRQAGEPAEESLLRFNLALEYEADGDLENAREQLETLAAQARQNGDEETEATCRDRIRQLGRAEEDD